MYRKSTLNHAEAASAVNLFEQGCTARSVSLALNLHGNSVQMLYQRWQLRGPGALMTRERRQYDFDTKLTIVRRHINGESATSLCEEFDLPSPATVATWAGNYRRDS